MIRLGRAWVKQRGTAVIMALLVVSVVAAVATTMLTSQRISIKRTQQLTTAQQANYLSDGALFWAKAFVSTLSNPASRTWPVTLPSTSVLDGQGSVQAELYTTINMVNLNALGNKEVANKFIELLTNNASEQSINPQILLAATKAWVNKSSSVEFDGRYLAMHPPYRAAHQSMLSKTEFRLVDGVTPAVYRALEGALVALPETSSSSYLLHTSVELRDQLLNVYSILQRDTSEGKVTVKVIWHSRSTW